jgi:hypothetical protein
MPELQSDATVQSNPVSHAGQPPPPQSIPDSVPFFVLSVQVGG